MKTKIKEVAISVTLFLLTVLTPFAFGQMGGSRMAPGSGMGGMMGGQGYGSGYGEGQGFGPAPGNGSRPEEGQPPQNLTPEEQKARAKAFVDEYIRRYLPEYKLEKRNNDEKSK